jgi:hypothetical protein
VPGHLQHLHDDVDDDLDDPEHDGGFHLLSATPAALEVVSFNAFGSPRSGTHDRHCLTSETASQPVCR